MVVNLVQQQQRLQQQRLQPKHLQKLRDQMTMILLKLTNSLIIGYSFKTHKKS
jgi:hypothetical protein